MMDQLPTLLSALWKRLVNGEDETADGEKRCPLTHGCLVRPAIEIAQLQTIQGYMVACERLGPGTVLQLDGERVLVRWSKLVVETWTDAEDLVALEQGKRLVTVLRCDGRGHKTLLRHKVAALDHDWTVELRPDNVVRVERSDGLCWTFGFNATQRDLTAAWIYPPEDADAEAMVAAEVGVA